MADQQPPIKIMVHHPPKSKVILGLEPVVPNNDLVGFKQQETLYTNFIKSVATDNLARLEAKHKQKEG
jgi:hypothetical protein